MAIRFPHQMPEAEEPLIASINTTPLVDVMLVLLIIFLITIPVVNSSIAVNLPREPNQQRDAKAQDIIVTVDAQGVIYWFDTALAAPQLLARQMAQAAAKQPQPELHIRADARADYESVGRVVYAAQQAGIARIGFLTEPPR
ncbi:biopolymer transporter ExbD [Caenimonas koreensis DSM 17982]|uniref:Biopolymer transporter ExbD n=1 Tax=Caenimonas koreensis DSM 17982 TaxID=1121255 RepID=A0A844B5T2_9BURK|nr:biopolymer transporter ExbD [Caenimonas koreensis]MRD46686.1 biopolymer transporter ExbD [Caenimonas koreensis DSM 17982]